nr:hypothetical protein [Candidatus Brachybacter algidus]
MIIYIQKEDELLVFEYMQAFRDYKISPYNPFSMHLSKVSRSILARWIL